MNKWFLGVGALVLTAAVITYSVPISSNIHMSVEGIQWSNNDPNGSFVKKTIRINGVYQHYLFKSHEDRFNGSIAIEGYPYTSDKKNTLRPMTFSRCGQSDINYMDSNNKETDFGQLYCDPNFKKFFIQVFKLDIDGNGVCTGGSWDPKSGTVLCAPADNRNEAIQIAKNLYHKTGLKNNWIK